MSVWSEIAPQVQGSIAREDGRVCILERVTQENFADAKKKVPLPVPRLAYRLYCGEVLYMQEVSLNLYYPAQVQDPPTCLKCIASR